jgi:hypothetical protein
VERKRIKHLLTKFQEVLKHIDIIDHEIREISKEGTFINFGMFMNMADRAVDSFRTSDGAKKLHVNFRDGSWYLKSAF